MSAELSSQISRDWFDMKNSLTKKSPPLDIFAAEPSIYPKIARFLENYAENGMIEAKNSLFNHLFYEIKELQFRAIQKKEFTALKEQASTLVIATWLQRALLEGLISSPPDVKELRKEEEDEAEIKEIIAEINLFARNNPELLQSGGKINKIIKLVKILQQEQQKTREIISYPKQLVRRKAILANFRTRYRELELNIRQIFADFEAELDKTSKSSSNLPLYQQIDTADLRKNILQQLRQFLALYSSLDFASSRTTGRSAVYKYLLLKKATIATPLWMEPGILKKALEQRGESAEAERQALQLQNETRFSIIEWLNAQIPQAEMDEEE